MSFKETSAAKPAAKAKAVKETSIPKESSVDSN